MPIVSYAQNLEDVLLWRALQHVGSGVYLDIGAQDPIFDSVSKGFYEQGWRGIHVEPAAQYAELLRRDRPDEPVVHAAVSDHPGMLKFYEIPDTGMSTGSEEIATSVGRRGWKVVETLVAAITLDQIFANIDSDEVHWLKIDVEGFERKVLQGWRKSPYRPWVVVVEAVHPLTHAGTHRAWEHLLLAKGYSFVHFDGLNRYYLSAIHRDLKKHFRYGPCLWDEFLLPEVSRPVQALMQRHTEALERAPRLGPAPLDKAGSSLKRRQASPN
jgi:FkbM family methyltransferase